MSTMRAAISLIEDSRTDPDEFWRQFDLVWLGFVALVGVLFLFLSYSSLLAAWDTASTARWDDFWHTPSLVAPLVVMVFALLASLQNLNTSRHQYQRLIAVRNAAIAGEESYPPLAHEQPTVADAAALASGPISISPLVRPRSNRDFAVLAATICLLIIAFIVGLVTIVLLSDVFAGHNPSPALGDNTRLTGEITVACSALSVFLIHRYRRAGRPFAVTADDQGIVWRQPTLQHLGRHQHIAWRQALAFVTFSWRSESTYTHHQGYALIAPRLALCWEVGQTGSADARAAHDKLARLITANTGLPLCDLTNAFEAALAEFRTTATSKPRVEFPVSARETGIILGVPPLATVSSVVEPNVGSSRRLLRLGSLVALMAMPSVLVYGAGFALQRIQPGYFATFLTRSEAQPPLYVDKLDWPDGDWRVQQPTASDPASYLYIHPSPTRGAYQLTGSDPLSSMYAWEGNSFSDALIEVTAQQLKPFSGTNYGGVGVILRERSAGNQFVAFQIDLSGNWGLWDYSSTRRLYGGWLDIDSGQSAAIHRGVGIPNRIAVLARGDTFVLYVNGVYIGSRSESSAPPSGGAGVFVQSDPVGGRFSDFAVYPMYSGLPLFA